MKYRDKIDTDFVIDVDFHDGRAQEYGRYMITYADGGQLACEGPDVLNYYEPLHATAWQIWRTGPNGALKIASWRREAETAQEAAEAHAHRHPAWHPEGTLVHVRLFGSDDDRALFKTFRIRQRAVVAEPVQ